MAGIKYRTAYGVWINDMRNAGMPGERWPYHVLDEQAEKDIINCVRLQGEAGYNIFTIWGLLATWGWPCDIASVLTAERRERVDRIIKAAHDNGMKIITGVGVYSWGFDEIVKNYPEVAGNNPHAMCASKDASWEWMKKIVDFVLTEFSGFDGIHMESADLGRCSCELCSGIGDVKYHVMVNIKTADYVREMYPDKIIMASSCGFNGIPDEAEEAAQISELSKHIDYFIVPHLKFRDGKIPKCMQDFHCEFGGSGGFWIYPPQRWDRMRWFLPHPKHTGEYVKGMVRVGSEAIEYYMGPTINPCTEFNIFFGGKMLSAPENSIEQTALETIERLYKPKDDETREKLAELFFDAEEAYISNSAYFCDDDWALGELLLTSLHTIDLTEPLYIATNPEGWNIVYMTGEGREAYRKSLEGILKRFDGMEYRVGEPEKIGRIKTCITNVIEDLDKLGYENDGQDGREKPDLGRKYGILP